MKRYLKYIFLALLAGLMTASCVQELELPQSTIIDDAETILVPRVTSFANQYVTRSSYESNETAINSLSVLVFNSEGALVLLQEASDFGGARSITLSKSRLDLTSATIVMFANMSIDNIKNASNQSIRDNKSTLTLAGMESYSYHIPENQSVITDLSSGFAGFPMIGGVRGVDLTKSSTQQDPIEVSLKILYAKVNFSISVAQGTENTETGQGSGISFNLTGYSVNNTSLQTSLAIPTIKGEPAKDFLGNVIDENVNAETDGATVSNNYKTTATSGSVSGSTVINGQPLTFTFYVSESRYNHNSDLTGVYPDDSWLTLKETEDIKNSEDKPNGVKYFYDDLIQQYKPRLAEDVEGGSPGKGLATYVLLNGNYTDYRGTSWNVNYKVYLGKDNAQNFHVDRNSEYTNYITIKGIRNNGSYGEEDVWVDHRVNVSYTGSGADDCVTITRETLIDSHIEVRPLRVKWEEGEYTFARVFLPYYTQDGGKTWAQRDEVTAQMKNWIGIELGDKTGSLYCSGDNNPSKGKRKYFTEALVSDLNKASENTDIISEEGQDKFIALANDQCAWVYIDEYWNDTSTATNPATQDRTAKIVVEFCTIADNKISVKNREEYILLQQPLIDIDGKYYIENYEEYLHSYNSHDKYNILTSPTDYSGQGLQWGFTQTGANRVSKSQFVTKMPMSQWTDWTPNNSEAYDFIHAKDVEANQALGEYKIVDKDGKDIDLTRNTGYNFTYTASANNGITISSMDKMPESAYQYCLSKNKFKEGTDGQDNEMLIRWYVPDVYELSEIFLSEESPLSNESYYWSSQAPYVTGQSSFFSADIASEVVDQARLVSKEDGIGSKPRTEKHRIRCLYNRNGETANMENRTPEGIGGLMKIPMTVKDNGYFDYSSWFTNLGKVEEKYPDPLPSYRFPKGDTDASTSAAADKDFGGTMIDGYHYYSKNPLSEYVWAAESNYMQSRGYYTLVHEDKWPGLTSKETTPITDAKVLETIANLLGISSICTISETDKSVQRSEIFRSGKKIEGIPSNVSAIPLDHNEESKNNLSISFDKGTNNSNSPKYEYYNEDGNAAKQQTWVKYWNVPEYTSQDFPSTDKKTFPAPEREVSYTDSEVTDAINREVNGWVSIITRYVLQNYEVEAITQRSIYSYESFSAARNAATAYFNEFINKNDEYKALTYNDISTPGQSVQLCSYSYTCKEQKNSWGNWKDTGNTRTGSGTLSKTLYSYVITYQKKDGTYYRYVAGTGGWGEEIALSEEPVSIEPEKPNADALTFYAGNTFTISCTKPNYYIRSIKVNYNTNIIKSGKTYLRFMDNSKNLPAENKDPEQMTYLDGGSGWSKWTSVGDNSSVSLRLIICDMNTNSWWIGNWGDPKMTHKNPSTSTQRGYSMIINSLEIRLEEKQ